MSNSRAKSSKNQSRRSRRSRLRPILTESDAAELDRAVAESGAIFRSLIISRSYTRRPVEARGICVEGWEAMPTSGRMAAEKSRRRSEESRRET